MKIVVIGKTGQLAQELQKQRDVRAFSKEEIDLADPSNLKEFDFDVLINAAAYNETEKAEIEPDLAFALNAQGVGKLAQIAKLKKAKFVHVSSDFVFSGQKGEPYVESDPVGPLSIYGASKALGEKMALQCSESYIFRTASLYSKEGNNFPKAILKRAREGKELKVIDDISMSPTNAKCLAEWIYRALDKQIPFGLYHAVNNGGATWYQFALKVLEKEKVSAAIYPCSYKEYPSKIRRPMNSILNISKLENEIGKIASWEEAVGL
jgi:dTDP-4-dehydrorhamnose reductase